MTVERTGHVLGATVKRIIGLRMATDFGHGHFSFPGFAFIIEYQKHGAWRI